MSKPLPPFSCSYSPNVPELLHQLGCSIALTTYQAGKVVFISAPTTEKIVQLPRTFDKPMGIGLQGDRMALATKEEVVILSNAKDLAPHYPPMPNTYDALFVPRATYYTGRVDIHDIAWSGEDIYGVNTSFSCLMKLDQSYNFKPYWQPDFITELASEDRCHLNGMVMKDGKPAYATAFNTGNTPQSWREQITKTGVLFDVQKNKVILSGLGMPHSPKLIGKDLYLVESAKGTILKIDPTNGTSEVVFQMKGFLRGLAFYKDYLFVGISKIRKQSSTFKHLQLEEASGHSGIAILHLPTKTIIGSFQYHNSVEEIYEVKILPGMRRPNILNTIKPVFRDALTIPGANYWSRPQEEN